MRYSEAYTGFLRYCSKKLSKSVDELVIEFRNNGIETRFHVLYEQDSKKSFQEYYKILRG